jgi:16S rRNA (cytidine1402-2'-O)-methyltransferase
MPDVIRRPALYVVATPIGNLADITLRALDTLRSVDLIAAEDTRVTSRLLAHFNIDKPVLALHQHNERKATSRLIGALKDGHAIALVSDAGTPVVSDPGANVVAMVRAEGFPIIPIPGPSALAAAWSVAGLTDPGFLFQGFLPARSGERRKVLQAISTLPYALVFYEAPHRVVDAVRDLTQVLGAQREAVVARELTKMFESVHACPLGELEAWLEADENRRRGEFVLIVAGAAEQAPERAVGENALRLLLEELPPAQAARLASRLSGVSRSDLYELAVRLKDTAGT